MKTYLRHKISNVVGVKELIALEYLDFEGTYRNYVEKHDFWEICYVQKGSITLTVDQQACVLSEHQLMVIPPERTHSYASAKGNQNRAFVICFENASHAVKPLGGVRFLGGVVEQECMCRSIEESVATFCMDEQDHLAVMPTPQLGGQQAIFLQLEYLLICLLRRCSEQSSSGLVFLRGEHFYGDLVELVIGYFRENIRSKLSLTQLCR